MFYKRKFGKRGLVAALVHESVLGDHDIMARLDAACTQTGITQDYDITFFAMADEPRGPEATSEMFEAACQILEEGYLAVVTVGLAAHNALDTIMRQADKPVMHVGVKSKLGMDDDTTFTMRHLHPLFEKNITEENRLYLSGMTPEQVEAMQEANKQMDADLKRRSITTSSLLNDNGYVMVVDSRGRPHHISLDDDHESGLPIKRSAQPKIFEA